MTLENYLVWTFLQTSQNLGFYHAKCAEKEHFI